MKPGTLSLIFSPPPSSGKDDLSGTLQRLLSPINAWVKSQCASVLEAYLVPEAECLMLYVIGRSEAYDFELGEKLSDFSIRLADQGIDLDTTLLPASSSDDLTAFFDPLQGPAIRIPAE